MDMKKNPFSLHVNVDDFIPATDAEMEKNTSGTTTQNIMLMNTVPSGRMRSEERR